MKIAGEHGQPVEAHRREVFDVGHHESGALCGDGAVQEEFCCYHVTCFGSNFAWAINAIPSDGNVESSCFSFSGAIGDDNAEACCFTVCWHVVAMDEADGVRSSNAVPNTLG